MRGGIDNMYRGRQESFEDERIMRGGRGGYRGRESNDYTDWRGRGSRGRGGHLGNERGNSQERSRSP